MENYTDEQLLDELRLRLEQSRNSFRDLTVVNRKLVDMNRKLEESEALKGNFLSNIRNEINNPLNSIIGLAAQLGSIVKRPEVTELVSLISLEASNLDFQLNNIFIAAELEAGEAIPFIEHVEVVSVVQSVLDSLSSLADSRSIPISFGCNDLDAEGHLYFPTDAQQLKVIISNLVYNGIEFNKPGGDVRITIDLSDGQLVLRVEDQGIGIAESDLKRIMDRFTQLDTGPTRSHAGHGLGLSVVKSLLDLLQGQMLIESEPGTGSVFTVIIPPAPYDAAGMTFAEGGNLFLFDQMEEL